MNTKAMGKRRKRKQRFRTKCIRNCIVCMFVALSVGIAMGYAWGWNEGSNVTTRAAASPNDLCVISEEEGTAYGFKTSSASVPTFLAVSPAITDVNGIYWGTKENPFRIGNAYSLMADTTATGEAHADPATVSFASQNISVALVDSYTPKHYEYFYGNEYRLSGTEAAVVLRISSDKHCNPQTAIVLNLETASGEVLEGYPLMNAAISGEYVTETAAGQALTVYKRFQYDANNPAVYLTLTHFQNGQAVKAYFLLESASKVPSKPTMASATNTPQLDVTPTPTPIMSYQTLTHGDCGDAVVELQERLIELGYLTGEADGIFGNMTLTAVKEAQRIGNMEQTGIADEVFQIYLFSTDVQ